jgi:NAD(P)-dependent dehydrogenase (short-subunit alcohol dehydrogenase family)
VEEGKMADSVTAEPGELNPPDAASIAESGVIVTGGSSGLGRATALLLARAGRPVAVWGRDERRTAEVAEECRNRGVAAAGMALDVGDRQAVIEAVAASGRAIGRIGGLAICHGISPLGTVGKLDFGVWDECLRTNLSGVAYTIEAALPLLREAGRGAAIAVVLSTSALRGAAITAEYTASKHGGLGLVRVAAQTLGKEGIRVNAVCPGPMDTPMMVKALSEAPPGTAEMLAATIPLGYVSNPFEVARVVCFMLSPASSYVVGAAVPVDGGLML